MLTLKITELVIGGSFNGVSLQKETFQEPLARARGTPAPALANGRRQEVIASQRNERFHRVFVAIDRLIAWIKTERHEFMTRLLGVAPPPRKKRG